MSQNDFIIDDGTGEVVLNDINLALQALASSSKGQNAPSTSYPSQFFANESLGKLSYRDGSNPNTYYNLANLDGGLFVDQTSTFNGNVIFNPTNTAGDHDIVFDASHNSGKGKLHFKGESRITVGDNDDLQITSIPSVSFIDSNNKTLFLTGKGSVGEKAIIIKTYRGDNSGLLDTAYIAYKDGKQELYFDDVAKFQTSADGIEVIGNILPTTDNDKPLGSSSKRFSTLHSGALNTGDINMSNLNDNGNEIDGSKGSWSIQEGSDDLFLINRVSGKKYKFNLTEIT